VAARVFDLVPKGSRPVVLDAVAAKRPEELLGLVASEKDASFRAEIISRGWRSLRQRIWPRHRHG
jgi:hypothetical protein